MRRIRFQFTLRTVFIISFVAAILCSLIKCEIDARKNYAQAVGVLEKTLAKAERSHANRFQKALDTL